VFSINGRCDLTKVPGSLYVLQTANGRVDRHTTRRQSGLPHGGEFASIRVAAVSQKRRDIVSEAQGRRLSIPPFGEKEGCVESDRTLQTVEDSRLKVVNVGAVLGQ
jgi:hypothetical protein